MASIYPGNPVTDWETTMSLCEWMCCHVNLSCHYHHLPRCPRGIPPQLNSGHLIVVQAKNPMANHDPVPPPPSCHLQLILPAQGCIGKHILYSSKGYLPTSVWLWILKYIYNPASLFIMEMQIKTTIKCHLMSVTMAIIRNTRTAKCWGR
jgi:hypothetical protein